MAESSPDRPADKGAAGPLLAALFILAALAFDARPVLHGLPLVLLMLSAVVQMSRELAVALDRKRVYPSSSVMNFGAAIVVVHVIYLTRSVVYSAALELVGTVLVALWALILVAAVTTDAKAHGPLAGARDLLLSLILPVIIGFAMSCAAILQAGADHQATDHGSLRLVVIVAAAWLGAALAALADRGTAGKDAPARIPASFAGLCARFVVTPAVLVLGAAATHTLPMTVALVGGVAGGIGGWLVQQVLDALARWSETDSFRVALPNQFSLLEPLHARFFGAGVLDYGGSLLAVFPLVLAASHWLGR